MFFTTIKELKEAGASPAALNMLISSLPAGYVEDTPIPIEHILESNGYEHYLWVLRNCAGAQRCVDRCIQNG